MLSKVSVTYKPVENDASVFPPLQSSYSDEDVREMNIKIENIRDCLQKNLKMSLCVRTRRLFYGGSRFWRSPREGNVLHEDVKFSAPTEREYEIHYVRDYAPSLDSSDAPSVPGIYLSLETPLTLPISFAAVETNPHKVSKRLNFGHRPFSFFNHDIPQDDTRDFFIQPKPLELSQPTAVGE